MAIKTIGIGILLAGSLLTCATADDSPAPKASQVGEDLFATVNGKPISQSAYQAAYASHVRNTFYHREGIADERLKAARQEVGEKMIERLLLLEEVDKRKIIADQQKIDAEIAGYEKRYATSPMWQQNRQTLLPGLKERLAEQNRLERLEQSVRRQEMPSTADTRKYYDAHPALFTEPEKLRLRTILLKVDPSASGAVWDAARAEAARIVAKLRAGADFAELARIHSHDRSAADGGDMGYLHLGMVPEALQARIDQLAIGAVGDPIDVLEGVGIFRLEERVAAKHRDFESVATRARDLLVREREKETWRSFLASLRKQADVRYFGQSRTAAVQ